MLFARYGVVRLTNATDFVRLPSGTDLLLLQWLEMGGPQMLAVVVSVEHAGGTQLPVAESFFRHKQV